MVAFLSVLLVVVLFAVLGVLLSGVIIFARGGETNRRWSNRLMNLRVATQAVAVLILVRPAWAHSCGCKSRRKLVTANEVKRNCGRATDRGEEAWIEAAGR